jgi:hypothetical protein
LEGSSTAFFRTSIIAVLPSDFWSPIEAEQVGMAPNLLQFCHIAPKSTSRANVGWTQVNGIM